MAKAFVGPTWEILLARRCMVFQGIGSISESGDVIRRPYESALRRSLLSPFPRISLGGSRTPGFIWTPRMFCELSCQRDPELQLTIEPIARYLYEDVPLPDLGSPPKALRTALRRWETAAQRKLSLPTADSTSWHHQLAYWSPGSKTFWIYFSRTKPQLESTSCGGYLTCPISGTDAN